MRWLRQKIGSRIFTVDRSLISRLFDVVSDTFLVKSRIHAKLNLQHETTIVRTVLQIRTNTHNMGRVYGDWILYTHYELVWYKKRGIRKSEKERGRFWLRGENQKFYCNTCKILLWLVRKRLTLSTRTFM